MLTRSSHPVGLNFTPGDEFETDQITACAPGHEINKSEAGFSSRHIGGTHFLICDGTANRAVTFAVRMARYARSIR